MNRIALVQAMLSLMLVPLLGNGAEHVSLNVGIVGSNSSQGLDNPVTVVQLPAVTQLLQDIADEPRTEMFVTDSLKSEELTLHDLQRLSLIRRQGDRFYLAFPYFTIEDHALIVGTLAPYVEAFTQAYRAQWREFAAILQQYDIDSVPDEALAYAIIGAFSLDWDGLDITARKGLRTVAKDQANGDRFVLWAQEAAPEASLKEIYWGSHNEIANDVRFVTFGDHDVEYRWGFPDLIWRVETAISRIEAAPPPIGRFTNNSMQPYYHDFLADVGRILIAARNGATTVGDIAKTSGVAMERIKNLLQLLVSLQYFDRHDDRYDLIVAVLGEQDRDMLEAALKLSNRIIAAWLDSHYDGVKADLAGLTARRHGVPYDDLYTQIWHYTFGLVNRELVRTGIFQDPYGDARAYKGFIPFAFLISIYDDESGITP